MNQASEKIIPSLSEHFLSVLHVIISFNPYNETMRYAVSLFSFSEKEIGLEILSNLLTIKHVVTDGFRTEDFPHQHSSLLCRAQERPLNDGG